jgi:hypothetical protein
MISTASKDPTINTVAMGALDGASFPSTLRRLVPPVALSAFAHRRPVPSRVRAGRVRQARPVAQSLDHVEPANRRPSALPFTVKAGTVIGINGQLTHGMVPGGHGETAVDSRVLSRFEMNRAAVGLGLVAGALLLILILAAVRGQTVPGDATHCSTINAATPGR